VRALITTIVTVMVMQILHQLKTRALFRTIGMELYYQQPQIGGSQYDELSLLTNRELTIRRAYHEKPSDDAGHPPTHLPRFKPLRCTLTRSRKPSKASTPYYCHSKTPPSPDIRRPLSFELLGFLGRIINKWAGKQEGDQRDLGGGETLRMPLRRNG
jgi:hypothetical protein